MDIGDAKIEIDLVVKFNHLALTQANYFSNWRILLKVSDVKEV